VFNYQTNKRLAGAIFQASEKEACQQEGKKNFMRRPVITLAGLWESSY
jgi:hypothetical protein